ncbi:serine hydrolase domain-containing protein [Streptomyces sp. NPDC014894]|uniref:serine hydrolase domain-containing protein n=1 Tax=Streptomyces sp. NPDC014894 TaxID=3364931 RepID=UPI0036FAEDC0
MTEDPQGATAMPRPALPSRGRPRLGRAAAALVPLVLLAVLGAGTPPAPAPVSAFAGERRPAGAGDPLRRGLEELVARDGFPAGLAAVRGAGGGPTRHYTAGVADLETGAGVPVDGRVRIASNSKSFLATVVLQLVAEGRISLDSPVETHLPGLLRGDGVDGREITIRRLLQHTSGLPNYTDHLDPDWFASRNVYREPRELLDLALEHPAVFRPGARWGYSNTNYVVAGLIVQKVTGRPVREEITRRIIEPLGLRRTYVPVAGDRSVRGPHPRGYHPSGPEERLRDITELDPSWGWATGDMISTPGDLNRFFSALADGRLLALEQLRQMRTTVDASPLGPGVRYGLGLVSTPLSCGGVSWGHGGDIPGYKTVSGAADDGRAVTLALTVIRPRGHPAVAAANAYYDAAFCGPAASARAAE